MDEETNTISSRASSTSPTLHNGQEDEQVVVIASSPFDNPDADVILRSSDMIDFRVFKVVLALASPVFKDMFSLPQPTTDDKSVTVPVIPISENSKTIDYLLRFCYPIKDPRLAEQEILVIGNVLKAAHKYEIHVAVGRAEKAFRDRLQGSGEDALTAYAIACHLKLEEEAIAAAKACLQWPILGLEVPELALVSGSDYFNLLNFHKRAGDAAAALFSRYNFLMKTCSAINPPPHTQKISCRSVSRIAVTDGDRERNIDMIAWWATSKVSIVDSLRRAPLETGKLSFSELGATVEADCNECHICKNQILRGWEEAREAIILAVKNEVSTVKLRISWN